MSQGHRPGAPVPAGRLSRLARFGGLVGGVAGGAALGAIRQAAAGRRPSLGDLLLTPANAVRVADELARLRGAAMKVGQLMSMDAGDLLPREIAEPLARLRAEAEPMPPRQLRAALDAQWGRGWLSRFESFDVQPIAAASIGQVHRARTRDGRELALKIQYPGVRRSIASDVDNVAALVRLAGFLPDGFDLRPLLAEAKRQLREEADYAREAAFLTRYGAMLAGEAAFAVPQAHADLSTADVLAMDYMPGRPVEALADAPQAERDRVCAALLELTLRELLDFRLMQTDPNFANYRVDETGRVVLLDFGAAREITAETSGGYRRVLAACLAGDGAAARDGLAALGLLDAATLARHGPAVERLIALGLGALRREGPYDFADRSLARVARDEALAIAADRATWSVPPPEVLLVQRKLAGMYLLAARLGARVDVRALLARRL